MIAAALTDRELLELAAKAAGIPVEWRDWGRSDWRDGLPTVQGDLWIPLTDDGDALRLARALHMTIAFEPSRGGWSVGAIVRGAFVWLAHDVEQCRAIVLAAATIGKAMP